MQRGGYKDFENSGGKKLVEDAVVSKRLSLIIFKIKFIQSDFPFHAGRYVIARTGQGRLKNRFQDY
jgi:hypothetical protein